MSKQSKKIEKNCPICNKTFFTYYFEIKNGRGKFCSIKCRGIQRTRTKNTSEHFWKQINIQENNDDCWEWKKCKDKDGYGLFLYKSKMNRSHRLAYFFTYPEQDTEENRKLLVLHTCDNPGCCNPFHLFLGTTQENTKDMLNKNRQAKGEKVGNAKLDEFDVKQILLLKNILQIQTVAEMYKVSCYTIYDIFNNKSWKHIERNIC